MIKKKTIEKKSKEGIGLIHIVCGLGYLNTLKFLVEEAKCSKIEKDDKYGLSPLHFASYGNKVDIIQYLLSVLPENEVNNPSHINNITPLMVAAQFNNIESVKMLIEKGHANVLSKDISGNTALFYALLSSNKDIIQYLIDHTKDKNVVINEENYLGLTLLDVSMLNNESPLYVHKENEEKDDAFINTSHFKNYQFFKNLSKDRILSKTENITKMNETMLEIANSTVQQEKDSILKNYSNKRVRRRNRRVNYNYSMDSSNDSSDDSVIESNLKAGVDSIDLSSYTEKGNNHQYNNQVIPIFAIENMNSIK